jgi:hypothetical protein
MHTSVPAMSVSGCRSGRSRGRDARSSAAGRLRGSRCLPERLLGAVHGALRPVTSLVVRRPALRGPQALRGLPGPRHSAWSPPAIPRSARRPPGRRAPTREDPWRYHRFRRRARSHPRSSRFYPQHPQHPLPPLGLRPFRYPQHPSFVADRRSALKPRHHWVVADVADRNPQRAGYRRCAALLTGSSAPRRRRTARGYSPSACALRP